MATAEPRWEGPPMPRSVLPRPLPRLQCSESPCPPTETPNHTPGKAHHSKVSASEEAGKGTLPVRIKGPTKTALPPSLPLKQYPKGDVPQRPPRINCAHWMPSSAKRAALATRDLSGHEEASIREAIPSK
ncbi:hypothetical protein HJG60_007824 [Phyllostomus discolor]|uniref:Uncharacterized protein n=1 Tax=Phyllostomus discolor TaxID=89673 RepID=A0A834EVH8_9CHIR|nr:hypothetical protein HJG60_007824 [Phyllostomus discolor]